jgi:N4-(beta-N-acetylglucosaminyl)-L-asparaginase
MGLRCGSKRWSMESTKVPMEGLLDAVEQGVRITEADGSNQSVGLGGLPDRDGIVSLDACIMDEAGNCGAVLGARRDFTSDFCRPKSDGKYAHVMLAGNGAYNSH